MPKRTAFILRESSSKLVPTPKTLSGAESELLIPPKSIIGTEGRAEVFSIGLKKVYIQPTKILTTSNINKLRNIFQTSSYRTGASYITNPLLISSYSIGSISKSKQKVMPYYKKSSEGISYSISNYIKPYKTISYSKKEEYKVPYYNKYSPVGYKYKSYEPYKIIKPFYKKPAPPKTPGILLFKSLQLKMKAKRKPQIFKQKTRYQVSFTGASLGIKGTGLAPGGLSVRGYIKPKKNNKSNPLLFN